MKRFALPLAALFVFTLVACSDSPTDAVVVGSVEVDGPALLDAGDVAEVSATVFDEDGNPLPDQAVEWSSSEEDVAVIEQTGLVSALEPGTTVITASAEGVTGTLELEVRENPCLTPVGEIEVGETVEGELTEESCFLQSWYHDPWVLELDSETVVQIDQSSEDFNPVLILTDAFGNQLALDEDSGEGNDARIEGGLPAGIYTIWASTFDDEDTGVYQLSVIELDES